MKKTLVLGSSIVFAFSIMTGCSELEEMQNDETEASEEEVSLTPEQVADEVFEDDLLTNEYNTEEDISNITVDFGDPFFYGSAQGSAEDDVAELLEEYSLLETIPSASIAFVGTVEDEDGNEEEGDILTYSFTPETIAAIDFEEFDSEEVPEVADEYWSHQEELEDAEQAEEERLEEEEAEQLEEEQADEAETEEAEETPQTNSDGLTSEPGLAKDQMDWTTEDHDLILEIDSLEDGDDLWETAYVLVKDEVSLLSSEEKEAIAKDIGFSVKNGLYSSGYDSRVIMKYSDGTTFAESDFWNEGFKVKD